MIIKMIKDFIKRGKEQEEQRKQIEEDKKKERIKLFNSFRLGYKVRILKEGFYKDVTGELVAIAREPMNKLIPEIHHHRYKFYDGMLRVKFDGSTESYDFYPEELELLDHK